MVEFFLLNKKNEFDLLSVCSLSKRVVLIIKGNKKSDGIDFSSSSSSSSRDLQEIRIMQLPVKPVDSGMFHISHRSEWQSSTDRVKVNDKVYRKLLMIFERKEKFEGVLHFKVQ